MKWDNIPHSTAQSVYYGSHSSTAEEEVHLRLSLTLQSRHASSSGERSYLATHQAAPRNLWEMWWKSWKIETWNCIKLTRQHTKIKVSFWQSFNPPSHKLWISNTSAKISLAQKKERWAQISDKFKLKSSLFGYHTIHNTRAWSIGLFENCLGILHYFSLFSSLLCFNCVAIPTISQQSSELSRFRLFFLLKNSSLDLKFIFAWLLFLCSFFVCMRNAWQIHSSFCDFPNASSEVLFSP